MQRIANESRINRRALIGKILVFIGIGVAGIAAIITFSKGREATPTEQNLVIVFAFAGLLIFQIGITLFNRWGRNPRMDEILDDALKGLNREYSIVHYLLGAKHVLLGPHGVLLLVPELYDGEIIYDQDRWYQLKQGRRGTRRRKLGKVEADVEIERRALQKKLGRVMPAEAIPEIKGVLVFAHPETQVNVGQETPEPAIYIKKLKSYVRQMPRGESIPSSALADLLPQT